MGGWIALLVALLRSDRVGGLALIAPAPDFTEDLMWDKFPDAVKGLLKQEGVYRQPSEYDDEPYVITYDLIKDGRSNLVLRSPIPIKCPIRILHGMQDQDVPWMCSQSLVDQIDSEDIAVTFVKNGDHRLSDPENMARVIALVDDACNAADEV